MANLFEQIENMDVDNKNYTGFYGSDKNRQNDNNIIHSHLPLSTIRDIGAFTSETKSFESFKIEDIDEYKERSYHCRNCLLFPIIKIIDENTISVKCEDEDNEKKKYNIIFYYKIIPKLTNLSKEQIQEFKKKLRCQNHNLDYESYCTKCHLNICENCKNDHKHENGEKNFIKFSELDKEIDNKKNYINKFFDKEFKKPKTKSYENKIKNDKINIILDENNKEILKKIEEEDESAFQMLLNLKLLSEIIFFCKDNFPNYSHYLNIDNIYFYLLDKLEIEYYSYIDQSKKRIKIFGKTFVNNNKNNCYLIIKDKKEDLCEKYEKEQNERIKITLVMYKYIENMSEMFYNCDYLSSVSQKNQWTTDEVTDMNSMFYGCIALEKLDNFFLNWDTSKVTDFSYMFYKCDCISSLENISYFDTKSAKNLSNMFYEC